MTANYLQQSWRQAPNRKRYHFCCTTFRKQPNPRIDLSERANVDAMAPTAARFVKIQWLPLFSTYILGIEVTNSKGFRLGESLNHFNPELKKSTRFVWRDWSCMVMLSALRSFRQKHHFGPFCARVTMRWGWDSWLQCNYAASHKHHSIYMSHVPLSWLWNV